MPIDAEWNQPSGNWFVRFDRPLEEGELNLTNWRLRRKQGALVYRVQPTPPVTAVGDFVLGNAFQDAPLPPGSLQGVDYNASPDDVRSTEGVAAAAFTGFPLAVTI